MDAGSYRDTTVAAGMSLATVLIALLNLAPLFGISLAVTIATYAAGFGLLYVVAPKIQDSNPENRPIPDFLGEAYDSQALRLVATAFSVLGYLSIFAMELVVGVTIVSPLFGNNVRAFAVVFFLFLVAYSATSGFRGIVATDRWQLRFILVSLLSLLGFFAYSYLRFGIAASLQSVDPSLFHTWRAPLSFCVGIAVINIASPLSETGTWQRVCATSNNAELKRGLRGAIFLFSCLWMVLILLGTLYPTLLGLKNSVQSGESSLMHALIRAMAEGHPVGLLILLGFLAGLFSAMVSTADSLLIAGTHPIAAVLDPDLHSRSGRRTSLKQVRVLMIALAVAAFALFMAFDVLGLNVVQLVFAIYGAQLALLPATAAILFLPSDARMRASGVGASASVLVGFVGGWAAAIYGHATDSSDWQFFAPVVALFLACASYFVAAMFSGCQTTVEPYGRT